MVAAAGAPAAMRVVCAHLFLAAVSSASPSPPAPQPPLPLPPGMNIELALTPSQAVASLVVGGFQMVPNTTSGRPRLGDVLLRVGTPAGGGATTTLKSADDPEGATPIVPLPEGELAASTVKLTGGSVPAGLTLERHYAVGKAGDGHEGLRMWFVLKNAGSAPVEVLSWAAIMAFTDMSVHEGGKRTLDTMAARLVMVDPAICGEHGYVSVTRMTGEGAVLLVVPDNGTGFQAWPNESPPQLMSLSKGHAQDEWVNASGAQWLEPSSVSIGSGESHTFSYRLLVADSIRAKDAALAGAGFAVLQAVPSYAIATDMTSALLHVLPPRGAGIQSMAVEPAGAIALGKAGAPFSNGFVQVQVKGVRAGRARVTLTYTDSTSHVASYFVMPPLNQHVQQYHLRAISIRTGILK
jgi:hypothetical protein